MLKSVLSAIFALLIPLTLNAQPELWGTVSNGGNYGHGYIFKTDSTGNNLQIVHHFDSLNGKNPGALLFASDNKLYGLTASGGQNNQGLFSGGVFYEYDLNTSVFTSLQHFGPTNTQITGWRPAGDGFRTLTEVSPGLIYGQILGGYQGGVVFAFDAATQTLTTALTLPTFQGGVTNSTLGNRLQGSLYKAADGFLYGTTYTNSQCPIPNPNFGSIVRIDPQTHAFSIRYLAPCNAGNGFQYDSDFIPYAGKLYSVAKAGGANTHGVIYSFDPVTGAYVNRYNFLGGVSGRQPSTMVQAANGKYYGTANGGTPETYHPDGCGILFEFDPANDQFAKKLDFTYGNGFYMNVGPFPFSMISGNNGKLYGLTLNGVFEYDPASNQTAAKGRFPINMGWYSTATPSLTFVCRKPSYSQNLPGEISVCDGENILIDLQSDNAESILWRHNGSIDTGQTGNVLQLSGTDTANAGSWQAELGNSCGTTLVPAIVIRMAEDIQVAETASSLEVTSGGDSFQWIDCQTQTPVPNADGPLFTPAQSGLYAVEVTQGSCTDTSVCYSVTIDDFSLPGQALSAVSISPNPVNTVLTIKSDIPFERMRVYDLHGKMVFSGIYRSQTDVSFLQKGAYFIALHTAGNALYIRKFIKE